MTTTRWLVIGVAGAALALGGVLDAATHQAGTPTGSGTGDVHVGSGGGNPLRNGDFHIGGAVPNPGGPPVIRD